MAASSSRTNLSNPNSDSITYNLVGFYEKGPIQVRVAYNWLNAQDLTRNTVTVNGNSVQNDEFQAAYGELDASIQYTIAKNYFLFAQALNLNNEISVKYWGTPDRIEDYEGYGRRFGLGVRVKF